MGLRSAISVSILAFSAVDENGKANLPPKNWSRYNVRVRIEEGGGEWSEEATDLMRSSTS